VTTDTAENNKDRRRPEEGNLSEVLSDLRAFAEYMQLTRNQSNIIGSVGGITAAGQQVYDKMLDDPHIFAVAQKRLYAVALREWTVEPHPAMAGNARAQEEAELIYGLMDRALNPETLMEVLHAELVGYSVVENVWAMRDGKWLVDALEGIPPERVIFGEGGKARLIKSGGGWIEPPEEKLIVHRFWAYKQNWWGRGLLEKAYWYWFFKKHGVKWYMIFLEKFGNPTVIAKYPDAAPAGVKEAVLEAIDAIQVSCGIRIPQSVEVTLLEAQRHGTTAAHSAVIDMCNAEISKVFLGNTLTTEIGDNGGAYAASQTQSGEQDMLGVFSCRSLERTVQRDLTNRLCFYNGVSEPYPYYRLDTSESEDLDKWCERAFKAWGMGIDLSVGQVRDKLGLEAPAGTEDTLKGKQETAGISFGGASAFGDGTMESEAEAKLDAAIAAGEKASEAFDAAYETARDKIKGALRAAGDYAGALRAARRIDVKAEVARALSGYATRLALAGAADSYAMARAQGVRTPGTGASFASAAILEDLFEELPPEQALEFWRMMTGRSEAEYAAMESAVASRVFEVAGLENEYLRQSLASQIETFMESGGSFAEWAGEVDKIFDAVGAGRMGRWHLETVLRTNSASAYSGGRLVAENSELFRESLPYVRIVAVGDSATRPEHAAINGLVLRWDHPWWQKYAPPFDYNCRCTWVRLTEEAVRDSGTVVQMGPVKYAPKFLKAA